MSTTEFLIGTGLVFATHFLLMLLGERFVLARLRRGENDLFLEGSEGRRLLPLQVLASTLFAFIFVFLLAQTSNQQQDISFVSGLILGLLAGFFVYGTQGLQQLALFARARKFFMGQATVGILVSILAGIMATLLL